MTIIEELEEKLGDLNPEITEGKGFISVSVETTKLRETAKRLLDLGFDHVKTVTAVDYKKDNQFEVIYHASSYLNTELAKYIIELKTRIPRDNPVVESLSDIWISAEFLERETFEYFGINFTGHPDLRPILLLQEIADQHPLRKDFIVKEEGIFK
ncbi:MAG: NADH-quinone oxidoreductase subunit C [Desulfurococcales archaeon]|nr:NADH-quinone oxidoreductase subunit C [Desulfurococcales archaeon]